MTRCRDQFPSICSLELFSYAPADSPVEKLQFYFWNFAYHMLHEHSATLHQLCHSRLPSWHRSRLHIPNHTGQLSHLGSNVTFRHDGGYGGGDGHDSSWPKVPL